MLQRGFNGVGVTVAINQAQWEGSGNCGKCIKVRLFGFDGDREGGGEGRSGSDRIACGGSAWPPIFYVSRTIPLSSPP